MRRLILIMSIALTAAVSTSAQQQARPPFINPFALHLAIDRQLAWRDYPRDINDAADRQLIEMALSSSDVAVRRIAIRGVGRFQDASNAGLMIELLRDP